MTCRNKRNTEFDELLTLVTAANAPVQQSEELTLIQEPTRNEGPVQPYRPCPSGSGTVADGCDPNP